MRLIDADKLKEELKVNGLGYQYYMLDNAPTVEAITIEWISKYSRGELSSSDYWAIIRMVGDWRKENE